MIVKLKDIATEYSASVYQKYNVSNNDPFNAIRDVFSLTNTGFGQCMLTLLA